MPNMSYCRFHNTLLDLRDCAEALEEMAQNQYLVNRLEDAKAKFAAAEETLDKFNENDPGYDDAVAAAHEDAKLEVEHWEEEIAYYSRKINPLSAEEFRAARSLLELCAEISEAYDDSILTEENYE